MSPTPLLSNGPVMVTLRSDAMPVPLTVGFRNGRRFASASTVGAFTKATPTSCGPAVTGVRISSFSSLLVAVGVHGAPAALRC